jgi:hypothetical protein
MRWKSLAFAATAAIALAGGSVNTIDRAYAACEPGDKIDRSTVEDARKKIQAAGYQKVGNLKKGCDNYWHATAEKNGAQVFVVLSPQGEVMEEAG